MQNFTKRSHSYRRRMVRQAQRFEHLSNELIFPIFFEIIYLRNKNLKFPEIVTEVWKHRRSLFCSTIRRTRLLVVVELMEVSSDHCPKGSGPKMSCSASLPLIDQMQSRNSRLILCLIGKLALFAMCGCPMFHNRDKSSWNLADIKNL